MIAWDGFMMGADPHTPLRPFFMASVDFFKFSRSSVAKENGAVSCGINQKFAARRSALGGVGGEAPPYLNTCLFGKKVLFKT